MIKKVTFILSLLLILGMLAGCGAEQLAAKEVPGKQNPIEHLEDKLEAVEDRIEDRIEIAAEALLLHQEPTPRPVYTEEPAPAPIPTEPAPTEATEPETTTHHVKKPTVDHIPATSVPQQEPPTELPAPRYIECTCTSAMTCAVPETVLPGAEYIECACPSSPENCAVATASKEAPESDTALPPPAYIECPCPPVGECEVDAPPAETVEVTLLTGMQAEDIALSYMGYTREQVSGLRNELEYDDGVPQYEVAFAVPGWNYEFEIHAETGEILAFYMQPFGY